MKAIIKTPLSINEVTAYFLSCGYFYREVKNNIETSIDKKHSLYVVAKYNQETAKGIESKCFDKLNEAKKYFKSINN